MKPATVVIRFDVKDPDISKVRELARACREGRIVAFPTETVYGIGGPMNTPDLASRLDAIKNRSEGKYYSYHIASMEMLDAIKVRRNPKLRYFARMFWPGPLTLLCHNASGEKVGIRYPRHRLTVALINAVGVPFIATSANRSGAPSPKNAEDVMNQLNGEIDYVIDAGPTELGEDSTVVDLTTKEPEIVRAGAQKAAVEKAIERVRLGKFPRKRILIVCTGNSCRSPMAAGWLQKELQRKGLQDEIEVTSCGIGARGGNPPTAEAIYVMKNQEIDISNHRSKACMREDVLDSDLIIAMGQEHYNFILGLVPSNRPKMKILNVPDPIGMGMMIYEEVINNIERKLKDNWNEIISEVPTEG